MSIPETVEKSSVKTLTEEGLSKLLADHARQYAGMGYYVLPCHNVGSKTPKRPCEGLVPSGVKDASNDVSKVEGWWKTYPQGNVAIAGGHGLIVIDLDVKDGKNGVEDLRRIAEDAGLSFPEDCPMAKTPSGGYHLFYHCKNSDQYKNGVGITYKGEKTGIDIRADGGCVVAAPSAVKDPDKEKSIILYEWVRPLVPIGELPELPEWLKEVLPKKTHRPPTGKPLQEFRDKMLQPVLNTGIPDADREYRILQYIATTDESIEKDKGSDTTIAVLGRIWWGFDLTDDELQRYAQVYNAERCHPPWLEKELNRKVKEVLNKWQPRDGRPRGCLLTEGRAYQGGGGSFTQDDKDGFIKSLQGKGTPAMSEFEDKQWVETVDEYEDFYEQGDFPVAALPKEMGDYVNNLSSSLGRPPQMIVSQLLPALAGAIGTARNVWIKGDWIEPCILWGAMIAPPPVEKPAYST